MPNAGQIRLKLTSSTAAAVAQWLTRFTEYRLAQELQLQFAKAARRRRSTGQFMILVDRKAADWLASRRDAAAMTNSLSPALRRVMDQCRPSRGRASLTQPAREAREQGKIAIDQRHRQRVARSARDWRAEREYDDLVKEWIKDQGSLMSAAGTGGRPFPEKK